MNCLEFRRNLVIEPGKLDEAMLRHRQRCSRCTAYAERQLAFEQSLRRAAELPVPTGLAARIRLVQGHEAGRIHARQRLRWLALAASLLLVVGAVGGHWSWRQWHSLEHAVFVHIDDEFFALHRSETVSAAQVNEALQPVGTAFPATLGTVHFASVCPVGSSQGAHLVLRGQSGPVTVMVLPREPVSERLVIGDKIRGRHYTGVIVPAPHGSIVVVGERGEDLDAIAGRVRASVQYQF